MNELRRGQIKKRARTGLSLVEAAFSIGLMSVGFLTLIPLLAVGMKASHGARDDRATAQIARTLIEEARQGTLATGPFYLDFQGNPCSSATATYTAQASSQTLGPSLSRLTLRVAPIGAPDRARTYAVVIPTP